MKKLILSFNEIDKRSISAVGGKAANLGELTKAGFPVPPGFSVTTHAFSAFLAHHPQITLLYDRLDTLDHRLAPAVQALGAEMRGLIESCSIPDDIAKDIETHWQAQGPAKAYAVRSSATAEDLEDSSFAGQQDTFLNVLGLPSLLSAVRRCWASLFTDRAIIYRTEHRYDHRQVLISVAVQEMVSPSVSGVMFTADPISGHREVVSIDASFGLGEAIVSGIVSGDGYKVRRGEIVEKRVAEKKVCILGVPGGGTEKVDVKREEWKTQALEDGIILSLAGMGKAIEKHYGAPQDIEWCVVGEKIYIVQSRPITSLYPSPVSRDGTYRVYVSFAHHQMMTDAIKPLGISIFRTLFPFGKDSEMSESGKMEAIGSRLYYDVTDVLSSFFGGAFKRALQNVDERIPGSLEEVRQRPEFKANPSPGRLLSFSAIFFALKMVSKMATNLFWSNHSRVASVVNNNITSIINSGEDVQRLSGQKKIERIQQHLAIHMISKIATGVAVYAFSGVLAKVLVEGLVKRWLGDEGPALADLNKSLEGNVTTEMGMRVGDLADLARQSPQLVQFLENTTSLSGIETVPGGLIFKKALKDFLGEYGCRGNGEVDITRRRWAEDPMSFIPAVVGQIKGLKPGEHRERYAAGKVEAERAIQHLLGRVKQTFMGTWKHMLLSRLIHTYRYCLPLREHPKFTIISVFAIFKRELLKVGGELVQSGVLGEVEDIFYFSLSELHQLLGGNAQFDARVLCNERKDRHERCQRLRPPRVITSDGEVFNGSGRDASCFPKGAVPGTPVSVGVIEARAHVMLSPSDSSLGPGEILVTKFTDPSWTAHFNSAGGLVTEIGGQLTHGSVIAREYGIPAVVGIDNVTDLIKTGDFIRVDGSAGYILVLEKSST